MTLDHAFAGTPDETGVGSKSLWARGDVWVFCRHHFHYTEAGMRC